MRNISLFRVSLALVAAGIGVLSLLPDTPPVPVRFSHVDKIEHLAAYLLLAVLAVFSFSGNRFRVVLLAILACCLYGGMLELAQSFTGRSPEIADFICSCAGAAAGGITGEVLRTRLRTGR